MAGCTGAIPTLGYPTRYEAAAALRSEGLTVKQIAEKIGTSERAVDQLLAYARRGRSKRETERICVPTATLVALAEPAKRRGMRPADLARRILAIVAEDGITGAILDDGPTP